MNFKQVSDNAVRRVPRYLRRLDELAAAGVGTVLSKDLGNALGLTAAQVRQDLSSFGSFGLQGFGYPVQELRASLRAVMGTNRGFTAVLIGCGHLGKSLLQQFSFSECGIELIAAFDREERHLTDSEIPILSICALEPFLAEHPADLAVLTVSRADAAEIAGLLARSGVKALWNFTGVELSVGSMIVENISFSDSLLCLGYHLTQKRQPQLVEAKSNLKTSFSVPYPKIAYAG